MRSIVITIGESGYNVHEDGKHCDGLCWGEMLEQVALLTVPPARVGNGYAMHTNEEWTAIRAKHRKSMTLQERPPLLEASVDVLSF